MGERSGQAETRPPVAGPLANGPRRRGRRPAGEDTREALLAAARTAFTEQGYGGATVRGIAAQAGVDPAMVSHWFGGKQGLFAQAVLELPFEPGALIDQLLQGDRDALPERIVRTFVTVWDGASGGGAMVALVRSIAEQQLAADALREFLLEQIFSRVSTDLRVDHPMLRASLCASQLVGLGMARYVLHFEPLASAAVDQVVPLIAPTLHRYLFAPLD